MKKSPGFDTDRAVALLTILSNHPLPPPGPSTSTPTAESRSVSYLRGRRSTPLPSVRNCFNSLDRDPEKFLRSDVCNLAHNTEPCPTKKNITHLPPVPTNPSFFPSLSSHLPASHLISPPPPLSCPSSHHPPSLQPNPPRHPIPFHPPSTISPHPTLSDPPPPLPSPSLPAPPPPFFRPQPQNTPHNPLPTPTPNPG